MSQVRHVMSAKSSRPEPGWYLALSGDREYVVVVPAYDKMDVVAILMGESKPYVYTYPSLGELDFPWNDYTLEKL